MLGTHRRDRSQALSFLFIAGVLLLVGWPAKGWGFCADDLRFLRVYTAFEEGGGTHVRWGRVLQDFHSAWAGNPYFEFFRPLVSLSLGIDFAIFGANPGVSAFLNLGIHMGSSFLVYLLAKETLPSQRSALPAALFFALSPLAHENIAWLVGRCGLTVFLGLLGGLLFLRAYVRGEKGLALFLPALSLALLNLMTMESALAWTVFPLVCVLLWRNFHPGERGWGPSRPFFLVLPFGILGLAYLAWRSFLFENPLGAGASLLAPKSLSRFFLDYGDRLLGSIVPLDTTWLQDFVLQRVFFWFVLTPWLLGSLAPMSFHLPKSRFYRRGAVLLLGFWVLATTPNVHFLQLKEGLDSARALYYCLPPLALLFGLLAATSRYGRVLGILVPLVLGMGLHHRLVERVKWAEITQEAIRLVDHSVPRPQKAPIALLDQLGGVYGAPGIPPGDFPLALYPPLLERRIDAFSLVHFPRLHGAKPEPELSAPAWIAKSCSGFFVLKEAFEEPELRPLRAAPFLEPSPPLPPLSFRLQDGGTLPKPRLESKVPQGAHLLLVYAGGRSNLVLPWDGGERWPPGIHEALLRWRALGGRGALFACFAEIRKEALKPSSVLARSAVQFGRIP